MPMAVPSTRIEVSKLKFENISDLESTKLNNLAVDQTKPP